MVIECSKGIYSTSYGIPGEKTKIAVALEYLGADLCCGAKPALTENTAAVPDDRFTMRYFASPSDRIWDPEAGQHLFVDGQGRIYTMYWSYFALRDDRIREKGLLIRYTVPEKLAGIGAVLRISVDGTQVVRRPLTESGTFSEQIDVRKTEGPLVRYLEQSHRLQKQLLGEFVRFCGEHDIPYYLFCGTALAAVRGEDFLEWDDDTDVAVTREAYEKLVAAAKEEWNGSGNYLLVRPEDIGENTFLDCMTRLIFLKEPIRNTLYDRVWESVRGDIKDRAVLDVYILENAARTKAGHMLQTGIIRAVYGMLMAYRNEFKEDDYRYADPKKVRIVRILRRAGRYFPVAKLLKMYRWICGWHAHLPSEHVFQSNGYIGCIGQRYRKDWFAEGRPARFLSREMTLPRQAEAYLALQYGAYERLPKCAARRPGHNDLFGM